MAIVSGNNVLWRKSQDTTFLMRHGHVLRTDSYAQYEV